jgi:hypothetical protein
VGNDILQNNLGISKCAIIDPLQLGQQAIFPTVDKPKVHANAVQKARLGYAERGWWSFAAPFRTVWVAGDNLKQSIKWACPETDNVNWGATIDPDVIRAEFNGKLFFGKSLRNQNVGIVTGSKSGIIDIETDTAEHGEGVDGETALKAWQAVHGAFPATLSFVSPSGSIHRIYNHPGKDIDGKDIHVKSFDGTSAFGKGVDCKADGGYMFLAPPSYRPPAPEQPARIMAGFKDRPAKSAKAGGYYQWITAENYPIADLTPAMCDVLIKKPEPEKPAPPDKPTASNNPFLDGVVDSSRPWAEAALENETALLAALPQGHRNRQLNKAAFSLGQIVAGGSLSKDEVVDALIAACKANGSIEDDHDASGKKACMKTIASGLEASENSPRWPPSIVLEHVEPTSPDDPLFMTVEAARYEIRKQLWYFVDPVGYLIAFPNPFLDFSGEIIGNYPPPVTALCIGTGLGKTSTAVRAMAWSDKTFVYAVPTLNLADSEIARPLLARGIVPLVWRGRTAKDPNSPGNEMCLRPDAVKHAVKIGADVNSSCCKYKGFKCPFFDKCGYKAQEALLKKPNVKPRIIICASDNLFHANEAIGTPDFLIVDEGFYEKQLRGVEIGNLLFMPFNTMKIHDHELLANELEQQQETGGLQRKFAFSRNLDVKKLISEAYEKKAELEGEIGMRPDMSDDDVERLDISGKISEAVHNKKMILILKALRHMQEMDWIGVEAGSSEGGVSGRLSIEVDKHGARGIRWTGIAKIAKQYRVETLLMDATMPDEEILRISHPRAMILANIRVAAPPSVFVQQIIGAPTSSRKLIEDKGSSKETVKRHRQKIRREILRQWLLLGRGSAVVICQQEVEMWLREDENRLPDEIELAHFNAIAGLDRFKDVRLEIVVGRILPRPSDIEAMAGTLTGQVPSVIIPPAEKGKPFTWYDSVQRIIRQRDGSGIAIKDYMHPDPFCESLRSLVCVGGGEQAYGRARDVNRTEETPLKIHLLSNTVLPLTIDEVLPWTVASALIETAVEGVMLTSPVDLMKVWPAIWKNQSAAERTVVAGIPTDLPGFELVIYQLDGPKMKPRIGWFDRSVIPDPAAWLERRLGPLTVLTEGSTLADDPV